MKLNNRIFTKEKVLKTKKIIDVLDMDNVMDSIYLSEKLHKQLIRKCHPDRFLDDRLVKIANELSKQINENSTNYSRLIEIKLVAMNELNLEFK